MWALQEKIASEFERDFNCNPHFLFPVWKCNVPKKKIDWRGRASWRYVYIKSTLWKNLPLEVYNLIDSFFSVALYKCIVCRVTKTYPFKCIGKDQIKI
jgi:hypothetical protein